MSAEPYRSIACAFHETLEFAVLRRYRLRLVSIEAGIELDRPVRPTDVATRDGAEWLSYVDDQGRAGVVRLDCIVSAEPVTSA